MTVPDCRHCATPNGCRWRVCDTCPCPDCVQRRTAERCRECVTWIGRLGAAVRNIIAQVADDRGTSHDQARRDLLAAYHRHHQEDDS